MNACLLCCTCFSMWVLPIAGVLRLRGRELESDVFNFITALVDTLPTLEHRDQTVNGVLHAVRALARHHLIAVTNAMLCFTRPHPPSVMIPPVFFSFWCPP